LFTGRAIVDKKLKTSPEDQKLSPWCTTQAIKESATTAVTRR
jgi:hypothetical protein